MSSFYEVASRPFIENSIFLEEFSVVDNVGSIARSGPTVSRVYDDALLDGLRANFTHPSDGDVLAFHEAFADLVAIFQHFSTTRSSSRPYANRAASWRPRICSPTSRASSVTRPRAGSGRSAGMRCKDYY